jgi:hypothetical protein
MRIQHVAQSIKSWPDTTHGDRQEGVRLPDAIEHIRWRLWHGQVTQALDLIADTLATLSAKVDTKSSVAATAKKLVRLLCALDIHVSGQSELIIDYATARRRDEPISTAPTEGTLQWLLHRWMAAQQQMRWSPRGAHLMLKVRTSVTNDTFDRQHAAIERWTGRPFRPAA